MFTFRWQQAFNRSGTKVTKCCFHRRKTNFHCTLRYGDGVVARWGIITSQSRWRTSTMWRLEWRRMWWEFISKRTWMRWLIVQVLFRYEDPKKIVVRCWIGLACIPVWSSIIIVPIINVSFPVWPLHEPDLSNADPNYGELARPGAWRQNKLPDGQCKIHQQRYFLSFWLISTLASFLSQVLGSFGLFSCQLWASTTL